MVDQGKFSDDYPPPGSSGDSQKVLEYLHKSSALITTSILVKQGLEGQKGNKQKQKLQR